MRRTDNDRKPHFPSSYNVPNVISVAALDRNDQLARFSNFGAKSVAVAAPGVDILSTWLGNAVRREIRDVDGDAGGCGRCRADPRGEPTHLGG